jgi:hypothetical protein
MMVARSEGDAMCRNITPLRGLDPQATEEEIQAAALQYVRKVGSISKPSAVTQAAIDRAVRRVADATADLLAELPPRQRPPAVDPPLRRLAAARAAS